MAAFALTNVTTYVNGHDFTCDQNQAQIDVSVNPLDVTTMCSGGATTLIGGVRSSSANLAGFWQAGADQVDPEAFADLSTSNNVVTFAAAGTEGARALILRTQQTNYQLFGQHGEAAPFSVAMSGSDGQGVIESFLAVAKQSVTSTGALGTGVQHGAVAADEYLYASFHVFSAGTTITAVVESDDNGSFSSATTRATFGPITTTGGNWATRVAGAITDDYWRVRVTAITGTFSIAAAIGIG